MSAKVRAVACFGAVFLTMLLFAIRLLPYWNYTAYIGILIMAGAITKILTEVV